MTVIVNKSWYSWATAGLIRESVNDDVKRDDERASILEGSGSGVDPQEKSQADFGSVDHSNLRQGAVTPNAVKRKARQLASVSGDGSVLQPQSSCSISVCVEIFGACRYG